MMVIIGAITTIFFEKYTHISATPVLPWTKRRAVTLLKKHSDLNKIYQVVDLGCGWGGMVGTLNTLYPRAQMVGYELSPFPYWFSKIRFWGKKNIIIHQSNFLMEDLSRYDVVFCYLSPHHMNELKPQLDTLKKRALVMSCSFPILGWTPIATESIWSLVKIPVYLYRM